MRQHQVPAAQVKQLQRLILSPQMQQALYLLQLPVLELATAIEEEVTQNPVLEIADSSFASLPATGGGEDDSKSYIESRLSYEHSLFEHLLEQAKEVFSDPEDLRLAEWLLGNLDQTGLLSTPLEELALLEEVSAEKLLSLLQTIQTFEPLGVGARSPQEALLIQLKGHGKESSLAFRVIADHYDDVIHNRIPIIAKKLRCSAQEIQEAIVGEIATLDLHPGSSQPQGHYSAMTPTLTPDVVIRSLGGKLEIEINDERIPPLRLNSHYIRMLAEETVSSDLKSYIQEKVASSKWLLRNLQERHQTLYRIAHVLSQIQHAFFTRAEGKLVPLTMKEIAEKLELNESTIARAVANKYLSCDRGIFPLRSFFTQAYQTEEGNEVSTREVKRILQHLVEMEDKRKPLSDEALSRLIKEKGIPCARRTVAKYRQELNIGKAIHRRVF